jgi:histidinol-phosphate aminotransferase
MNLANEQHRAKSYAERGDRLRSLNAYTPGMSRAEAAAELNIDPSSIGKMSSNENPIGPPPRAIEAVKELCAVLHEYPSPSGIELREAIGNFLVVDPDQVVLGTGASALFHSIMVAFTEPANEVISLNPSFPLYAATAVVHDCVPVQVDLVEPEFLFDLAAMEQAVNSRTRLIFLTRPNNPTANLLSLDEVIHVANLAKPVGALVIADEAYLEYVDNYQDETAAQLIQGREPHCDNVMITRTFGKAFGLGNLRIGYAVGTKQSAAQLRQANDKWSTGDVNRAAALGALQDTNHLQQTRMLAKTGRETLARELNAMGFYVVPNSQSINIMVDVSRLSRGPSVQNAGWSAKEFADEVFRRGQIMIRGDFSKTHVRISVAQPDINMRLIHTVQTMVEDQLE